MKIKGNKNRILQLGLFVFVLINNIACYGQVIQRETVNCGDYQVIIPLYQDFKRNDFRYEEGYYRDYYFTNPEGLITIHYGSMIVRPMINNDSTTIISESFVEGVEKERRGFFVKDKKKKIFREKYILPYSITIIYITEYGLEKFENIINNIRIIHKPIIHKFDEDHSNRH